MPRNLGQCSILFTLNKWKESTDFKLDSWETNNRIIIIIELLDLIIHHDFFQSIFLWFSYEHFSPIEITLKFQGPLFLAWVEVNIFIDLCIAILSFLSFKKEIFSKTKIMDSKNDCHRKILIKKNLKLFWLFLKTVKLENEIKSPVPGGYWTLGDILLSKCKTSFLKEEKIGLLIVPLLGAWQLTNVDKGKKPSRAHHLGSEEHFLFWFIFIS